MDLEDRVNLVRGVGEEIVTEDELREVLSKKRPVAYDGFEPSGNLSIAQGSLRAINVNKMVKAGVHFKFWVADWFGWMNNKMGGDLERIRKVGEYQVEVWKACGMDMDKVEFLWASEAMSDRDYWKKVISIARANTVKRITRCSQIMGRSESEALSAAQIFYPCMQAADIFHLKADITQLGMDQRKVNMLAREVGPKLGYWKPVVVSHHMLMGLGKPSFQSKDAVERAIEMKMSKSKPGSAIFMTDTREEIGRKIRSAYCPETVEMNPLMEYCRYIIFESFPSLKVSRPDRFGGDVEFASYSRLEEAYGKKELHPADLKSAVAEYLDMLIDPVRKHFSKGRPKRLLEEVQSFEITR